jgi:regulator of sigma E protease
MEIISNILYLILILGIIVFFHELGHFLAAKLFKMRVDRFSLGCPPRAFGKKIGDTDYCVSWLPIGGYVKIAGMIDESMDTEFLNKEPEPWEFRAKPVWQRSVVIVAGVVMNIVLAVLIFWGLNLFNGRELYEVTTIGHVEPQSVAERAGLLAQDRIMTVNEKQVGCWQDIEEAMAVGSGRDIQFNVDRNGVPATITVSRDALENSEKHRLGIIPDGTFAQIGSVDSGKPASKVGLQGGDVFVSINDTLVRTSDDVTRIIKRNPDRPIKVTWQREGQTMTSMVTPNESGMIGISLATRFNGPIRVERLGVFQALVAGVNALYNVTELTIVNIWHIIIGKASFKDSIGGPVRIAEMASQAARVGVSTFLGLMAILSISLAIINILPFPALDGGHLAFLIYEGIFKREVPNKVRIVLQQAGFILLMAFMVFVLYNDIFR